jgi:DNA-binding NarL/FixJ family response regulator
MSKPLTELQARVLKMIGEGVPRKQIATTLQVTTQAVHNHCMAIRRKLHLRSNTMLVRHAITESLK